MNDGLAHDASICSTRDFDVAVVGAGVIGLSIALELQMHGKRVLLIDRAGHAPSSSWAAAGIIPPMDPDSATDPFDQLLGHSVRMYANWVQSIEQLSNVNVEFIHCGGLHVARSFGEAAALQVAVQQWRADGVRAEPIDLLTLGDIEPSLVEGDTIRDVQHVFWLPDESQVRPPKLLQALRLAAERMGVVFARRVREPTMHVRPDGTWLIHAERDVSTAHTVCLAMGAWTQMFLSKFGVRLELEPRRGQMILFPPNSVRLRHVINEGPRYLVPRRDGRILVGSTVEDVGFDTTTAPIDVEELRRFAAGLVPALADVPIESRWAGLRPCTGDGYPYLGSVPQLPNAFLAAGHFRSGIALAPITARLIRQMILQQPLDYDCPPFRIDRG